MGKLLGLIFTTLLTGVASNCEYWTEVQGVQYKHLAECEWKEFQKSNSVNQCLEFCSIHNCATFLIEEGRSTVKCCFGYTLPDASVMIGNYTLYYKEGLSLGELGLVFTILFKY